jgi:hypothetical protein
MVTRWIGIVTAYQRGGLRALDQAQLRELAVIFVHEVRKGAFTIDNDTSETAIPRFLEHFRKEFAEDPEVAMALNYQAQILVSARRARSENHPVEAVILYATWAEHWVNAVLIARALASGLPEDDATKMLKDAKWDAKLGWLWRTHGLADLDPYHRGRLQHLINTRNEFVHYKWKGTKLMKEDANQPSHKGAISEIEPTIAYLIDYQLKEISGPAITQAAQLFRVDLRAHLRSSYEPSPDAGVGSWPPLSWDEPLVPRGAA